MFAVRRCWLGRFLFQTKQNKWLMVLYLPPDNAVHRLENNLTSETMVGAAVTLLLLHLDTNGVGLLFAFYCPTETPNLSRNIHDNHKALSCVVP